MICEFKAEDFEQVSEVKELALMFGLKVSGRKEDVINRINNYLREKNEI